MNVLQSIIKKVKNLTSEVKFRRSLNNMISERERCLEEAKENFEASIVEGNAENAYHAWRCISMHEENLKRVKEFNSYLNSSVHEKCEAA